jgi:L-alanine-DL-glutamate epimerase-like enolase superfamily enzyme
MLDITAGNVPLMIDANQQWTRDEAIRFCKTVDHLGLYFIEEPLSARDYEGHGLLCAQFDTPIATGEMLTSFDEVSMLLKAKGADVLQADAPRIGGFTPFLKVMILAEADNLILAPHFVMEQHLHVAATYSLGAWVEHFDWFDSVFVEDVDIHDGKIWVSECPGLGLTLTDEARLMASSRVEIVNR